MRNEKIKKFGYDFLTDENLQILELKGMTLDEYLERIYLKDIEDKFVMYGRPLATLDHAFEDGGVPDYIYVRPKWYITYVKNLATLLACKYGLNPANLNISTFDRMLKFAAANRCKLKGIIDFEIALKLRKRAVAIPVYYASMDRPIASGDALYFTNYLNEAKNAVYYTKKYLQEQGIQITNNGVEEVKGRKKLTSAGSILKYKEYDTQAFIIRYKLP